MRFYFKTKKIPFYFERRKRAIHWAESTLHQNQRLSFLASLASSEPYSLHTWWSDEYLNDASTPQISWDQHYPGRRLLFLRHICESPRHSDIEEFDWFAREVVPRLHACWSQRQSAGLHFEPYWEAVFHHWAHPQLDQFEKLKVKGVYLFRCISGAERAASDISAVFGISPS